MRDVNKVNTVNVLRLLERTMAVLDEHSECTRGGPTDRFRLECLRDDVRSFIRDHAKQGMGIV